MTNSERWAVFGSVSTGLIGYLLAVRSGDADCFARSGSIVIVIGIYFAMLNISEKLEKAAAFINSKTDVVDGEYIEEALRGEKKPKGLNKNLAKITAGKVRREISECVQKSVAEMKGRILRVEGWILIGGTVISGFGDLIV